MLWRISFHMSETSKKFNYPEHSKKLKKNDRINFAILRKFRMNLYRETAVGALGLLHLKKTKINFSNNP